MQTVSRGVLLTTVLVVAIGVGARRVVGASVAAACANTVLRTVPAPDGLSRAVIIERDCGATTGFSTQVAVISSDALLPDTSGNAFIADDDHARAPTDSRGALALHVLWHGADTLVIGYDRRARVFRRSPRVGRVWVRVDAIEASGT